MAPSISPEGGGNGGDESEECNALITAKFEFPLFWRGVWVRLQNL